MDFVYFFLKRRENFLHIDKGFIILYDNLIIFIKNYSYWLHLSCDLSSILIPFMKHFE